MGREWLQTLTSVDIFFWKASILSLSLIDSVYIIKK